MADAAPIRFESVDFRIGDQSILRDLTLSVARGETLALLGRSGSGKTTALRLVNRLIAPTAGRVLVEGRSTGDWDVIALRRSIGYVIQEGGLFPHFSVARNIGLVPELEGQDSDRIRTRMLELLDLVSLDASVAERRPAQLSGGQRQRVGVARALAVDPPILLMDEPFGALDPITRTELQRELASLKSRLHKTIIFVTHDVREALLLGDRIGLMEEGSLVWIGTPDQFRASDDDSLGSLREAAL